MAPSFLHRVSALLDVGGPASQAAGGPASCAESPGDERAFHERARVLTLRNVRIALLFSIGANLIWGLTDRFVVRALPGLSEPFAWARGALIVTSLLMYAALRSSQASRWPLFAISAIGAGQSVLLGYSTGKFGDLGTPWFHLCYIIVCASIIVVVRPALRLGLTPILPVSLLLGYSFARPVRLSDPMFPATVGFLSFATSTSVLVGHVLYALLRQSFFSARAHERSARAFEELSETLEERVREQTRELRMLAAHLENAREDERTRISRELHDELGQELTALRYALTFAKQRYERDPASIRGNLSELESLIQRTAATTRQIVSELRPRMLDDLGLEAGLEWLLRQTEERTGMVCRFSIGRPRLDIDAEVSIAAFRIIQEALTNAVRHAKATLVDVAVTLEDGDLRITVRDNGVGLPPRDDGAKGPGRKGGMGIIGMRERAEALGGRLRIDGPPGQGTTLSVVLPTRSREAAKRSS
ncbi:MAG: sensor histidine kinase [Minicystis sp.]